MKKVHFTDSYLINPQHPVTVHLIGAGGTGSQVLEALARMDAALIRLGHPGLYVTVFDADEVSESNIADIIQPCRHRSEQSHMPCDTHQPIFRT